MSDQNDAVSQPTKQLLKMPIIKETYATLFQNIPLCIAIIATLAAIDIALEFVIDFFAHYFIGALPATASKAELLQHAKLTTTVNLLCILLILLPANIAFYVGTQTIFLKKMTEGKTSIAYLFRPFKRFISLTGATLTLYGMMTAFILGAGILVTLSVKLGIGSVVFLSGVLAIGFIFYLSIRFIAFHFFGLLIVTKGQKALSALKNSYQNATPYVYDIFFASALLLLTLLPILALLAYIEVDILHKHGALLQDSLKSNSTLNANAIGMRAFDLSKYFVREILLLTVTVMHTIFYRKIFIEK